MNRLDLHAYVDGELSNEEKALLEAQFAEDEGLRQEVDSIRAFKAQVQRCAVSQDLTSEWRACVARLDELDKARRVESFVGRYSWALCCAFFLVIVVGGLTIRQSGANVQTADLARMATSFSRSAEDPRDAEAAARLEQMLDAADRSIDPNRMQVVHRDRGLFNGVPAVRLILRDAIGDMALLVFPKTVNVQGLRTIPEDTRYEEGKMGIMTCVSWQQESFRVVLCGERNPDSLTAVAKRLSQR